MKIEATGNDDDSSPFNCLPDEIVLQILNKLIDLKTLCFCYVVCKRFASIIVQVDTISLATSLTKPPSDYYVHNNNLPSYLDTYECESFRSELNSLNKFKRVKSLSIELSPTPHTLAVDRFLFKWKIKFTNGIESFVFLSPDTISETNKNDHEEEGEEVNLNEETALRAKKLEIFSDCLWDGYERFLMLLTHVIDIPSLEKVSITDSGNRGRIYLNGGGKVAEVRRLMRHSSFETNHKNLRWCYIRLLKLPVSGYTMKGVTLMLFERDDLPEENDDFINIEFKDDDDDDDFEDKEKAVYCEAVKEIFNKHRGLKELL